MTRSRQLLLLACCWPRLGQTERPSLAQRPRANVQRLQAGMDDEPPGKERGAKKTWLEDGLDDAPDMKDQDLYGEDPGVPPEESKAKYERELKLMTPDKIKMILNHMWRLHEQEHQKHNQMLKDRQDWLDKVQHQNDDAYVDALREVEPAVRHSLLSEPEVNAPHADSLHAASIEVVLGRDQVYRLLNNLLKPFLNDLFKKIKIPDVELIKHRPGKLPIKGLELGDLDWQDVEVSPEPPLVHRKGAVASVSLRGKASIHASFVYGEKGGSKVMLPIYSNEFKICLELFRDEDFVRTGLMWLSITTINLAQLSIKDEGIEVKTLTNDIFSRTGAAMVRSTLHANLWSIRMGVNKWGQECAKDLTFPLKDLDRIPLGPSGRCVGPVLPQERCRALGRLVIEHLDIHPDLSLSLTLVFTPYVERTQLISTGSGPGIRPIYSGRAMPYMQDLDIMGAKTSYIEALDECVRSQGSCESVWASLGKTGDLEYRLGRTTFPIDEEFEHCAYEGGRCMAAEGDGTHHMMIMRFGAFASPGDYVEAVRDDNGTGVPCRKDVFDLGIDGKLFLQFKEANLVPPAWDRKKLSCQRMLTDGSRGNAASAIVPSACPGKDCPLERPCALSSPLADGTLCIAEEINELGQSSCPSQVASVHCWKQMKHMPFTQPVVVASRTQMWCTGPRHLSCWPDVFPNRAPPSLSWNAATTIPPAFVQLSLPTDTINSVLAAIYSAGISTTRPFQMDIMQNVSQLCSVSKGFICLSKLSGINRSAPIKLAVALANPVRFHVDEAGSIRTALSLEVRFYAEKAYVPIDLSMRGSKECVRKEGVLRLPKEAKLRWVELIGDKLKLYSVHGRGRKGVFSTQGVQYDQSTPDCFSAKGLFKRVQICAGNEATAKEWLASMKAASKCTPHKRLAAAWVKVGLDVKAGVDLAQNRFLCLRPQKDSISIKHVGKLHCPLALRSAFLNVVKPTALISTIVRSSGILKPMQIWNLNALGKGVGILDPGIELGDNRVLVNGNVDISKSVELPDDADTNSFKRGDNHACAKSKQVSAKLKPHK